MFFVLEGPESSGKSSVILQVAELLKNQFDVLKVREPGGTWCGEKIRTMCMDKKWFSCDSFTQASLIYSARKEQWLQNIQPHLLKGGLVLSDRWHISTYVYQSFIANKSLQELKKLETAILNENIIPAFTFVLYAPFEVLVTRQKQNLKIVSPFNYAESNMRINIISAFKNIAEKENNVKIVDVTLPISEVSLIIASKIYSILHR